jgi:antitoxin YefM
VCSVDADVQLSVQYAYFTETLRMDAISYSVARANLAKTMDRVCEDHEALIITRNGDQSVVMLSLEDYQALEETAYLLRSPKNARRLLSAAAQLNAGKGTERELAE